MTTADELKNMAAELATEMYYRGAVEALDCLSKAASEMPKMGDKITIGDFLAVIAAARRAVVAKSKDSTTA